MDLSHWDLVDNFTLWEAACLAGGSDPKLSETLTVEQKAKANLIHRELGNAYQSAISAVTFALNIEMRLGPNETVESIIPPMFICACLPSKQLIQELRDCLQGRQFDTHDYYYEGDDYTPLFSREMLDSWFGAKGFKPVYSFVIKPLESEFKKLPMARPLSRDAVSDKLAWLNQASDRFWSESKVNRDDRGTYPETRDIVAWLVDRGFSETLADKAATIIRPGWAPTGRKPDE